MTYDIRGAFIVWVEDDPGQFYSRGFPTLIEARDFAHSVDHPFIITGPIVSAAPWIWEHANE